MRFFSIFNMNELRVAALQAFAIFFGLAPGHGQFVIINTERQRHKTDLLKDGKTWRQEDTNGDGQIGTQTDWQKD